MAKDGGFSGQSVSRVEEAHSVLGARVRCERTNDLHRGNGHGNANTVNETAGWQAHQRVAEETTRASRLGWQGAMIDDHGLA